MKIEHENLNETEIKVTLEMTREDWEPYQDKKLTELAKTLKVPGFRPGKVPKAVVLNQLGKTAVENETLEETIHELYRAYLTDKQITVLGRPTTNIINQPIDGRDPYVKVEFTQEAFPEIKLPDAKTVQIQVDTASEIESKLFDTQIQTLREKFATLVAVDRKSKADDYLSIDLKAFQNGQEVESSLNQSIRLNADALVMENMFKNLLGTKAGDVKKFQSTLVGGDHAGESADIEVTVNSVKQMDLPELNDDFAKLSSQYTTYKEQEASLKKSAQDRVKETQINQASQKLMEHLDTLTVPLPPQMIERMIAQEKYRIMTQTEEKDPAKLNKKLMDAEPEIKIHVEREAKSEIIEETLAKRLDVQINQDELQMFLYQQAMVNSQDPQEFVKLIQENDQLPYYISYLRNAKAVRVFLSQITVTDTAGKTVDLSMPENREQKTDGGKQKTANRKQKSANKKPNTKRAAEAEDASESSPNSGGGGKTKKGKS